MFEKNQNKIVLSKEMKVNYPNQKNGEGEFSIFLAGPKDNIWRKQAAEILKSLNFKGVVYFPETSAENIIIEDYNQSTWEEEAKRKSNVMVFFMPSANNVSSIVEATFDLGYYMSTNKKVLFGRPEGSKEYEYLDKVYSSKTFTQPYSTLEQLLEKIVELANLDAKEKQKIVNDDHFEALHINSKLMDLTEMGAQFIYPERKEEWEKFVLTAARGDLNANLVHRVNYLLVILSEDKASTFEKAQKELDRIYMQDIAKDLLLVFSKKGPDFYEYLANGNLDQAELEKISKIRKENSEFEKSVSKNSK